MDQHHQPPKQPLEVLLLLLMLSMSQSLMLVEGPRWFRVRMKPACVLNLSSPRLTICLSPSSLKMRHDMR